MRVFQFFKRYRHIVQFFIILNYIKITFPQPIKISVICGSYQVLRDYAGKNITTDGIAMETVNMVTATNYKCAVLCVKKPGCTVATVEGTTICNLFNICPGKVALQSSPNMHTYIKHVKGWTRPDNYSGPNPVLYLSFDDPSCITQHGSKLTTGKIGQGLVASANQSWASLGKFPERCFTQPERCIHGLTVSFWFRVDNQKPIGQYGSILSSRSNENYAGFSTWFSSTSGFVYQVLYGTDKACNLHTISLPTPGWIHSVFTWRIGDPLIVYHNGIQVRMLKPQRNQ